MKMKYPFIILMVLSISLLGCSAQYDYCRGLQKESPIPFSLDACKRCHQKYGDINREGITGCSVGIIIFMVGFFGGGVLSSFFTNDSEVIAQSAAYLKGFSADCILTCVLFSSIGYFNGCGKSIPVMIQGITSAFCIRIPVSIIMSRLPETSLTYVGMATPITTVYGIIFFVICFRLLNKNSAK